MEQRHEFLLHLCGQVDQEIPAAQDVQLRERRVHDEILRRKDHHLPDLLPHTVAVILFREEPRQSLRRHIPRDVLREETLPRLVDGIIVQIRGEDLHREVPLRLDLIRRLLQHHRQRISLLARGATRRPSPQRVALRTTGDQLRQHFFV